MIKTKIKSRNKKIYENEIKINGRGKRERLNKLY